jgi:hypothetical protein
MATGAPRTSFSGGEAAANRYVEQLGSTIVPLRADAPTSLDGYRKRFAELRTEADRRSWPAATYHRAPHQPLLLLCILDGIDDGTIRANEIRLDETLRTKFADYWAHAEPGHRARCLASAESHPMRREE